MPSTCHYKYSFLLYCICTPLVCIHNKSGPQRAHSSRKTTHGRHVPNDQLPVRAARAHLCHIVPRPLERPDTGDRVLMDGQQLRLRACARARHTGRACPPTYVGIAECVERRAVEAADCGAAASAGRFGRSRVVERARGFPAGTCVFEDHGLAVVSGGH